jgi:hypothetical protein
LSSVIEHFFPNDTLGSLIEQADTVKKVNINIAILFILVLVSVSSLIILHFGIKVKS